MLRGLNAIGCCCIFLHPYEYFFISFLELKTFSRKGSQEKKLGHTILTIQPQPISQRRALTC